MAAPLLTPEEIWEYIQDRTENNYLLPGQEFSATQIRISMDLAISEYDMLIPITATTIYTFPNKAILMYGTLAKMFQGQAALLARNTMAYSDGGLQIPVEERMQLYVTLAEMYQGTFEKMARALKLQGNIESGWGSVSSDYATMPLY